jgi:Mn-dependent DtxR family transcriptional regulator
MKLLLVCVAVVALLPAVVYAYSGMRARWRRSRELRRRILVEDALKHVHACELKGSLAMPESLAGCLGLRVAAVLDLIAKMETEGLVRTTGAGLVLTASGQEIAIRVIRAHRLLERHFADELRMPLEAIHGAADRQEHTLTTEQAAEMEARLGYPRHDPHGDPIPKPDGSLAALEGGVALTEQPVGRPAVIVHLEDEPPALFRQIMAAGLEPGARIEVLEHSAEQIVVWDGERDRVLTPLAAANVLVAPLPQPAAPAVRLTALDAGKRGRVVALHCNGLMRRRLLDLGVTPGATIERAMTSPFGDPTAYRVRGALIALRAEQADRIEIEPLDDVA